MCYLTDGCSELDNKTDDRSMRAIALGWKNYLFTGSDAGGDRAAPAYILIETAKLDGVDPHAWLTDVLTWIADHRSTGPTTCCPGVSLVKADGHYRTLTVHSARLTEDAVRLVFAPPHPVGLISSPRPAPWSKLPW